MEISKLDQRGSEERDDVVRNFFEAHIFYVLIGGAAFAATVALSAAVVPILQAMYGDAKWVPLVPIPIFIAVVVVIASRFEGAANRNRHAWLMSFSRRYGYIVATGCALYLGAAINEYRQASSSEGVAVRYALAACSQSPQCLGAARRYNGGEGVSYSVNSYLERAKRTGRGIFYAVLPR